MQWIGSRRFDLAYFFVAPFAVAAVGAACLAWPALAVPAWWAFVALADGPHMFATWTRTYLDGRERARRRALLVGSLPLVAVGFVPLALARATGSHLPWDLFLVAAALLSYRHNVNQSFGIAAIYEGLDGGGPALRRLDGRVLQLGLWLMFALATFAHPASRLALGLSGAPSPTEHALVVAAAALLGVGTLAYAVHAATRARARRTALFVVGPVLAVNLFTFFVVAAREPLGPATANPEFLFLASTTVGGTAHALQYLGIVFATGRRRYAGRDDLAARLGRSPALAYAALAAVSLALYVGINALRGGPATRIFPVDSTPMRAFLALYWGLFLHHYVVDGAIWKPSRDPALRVELGLA